MASITNDVVTDLSPLLKVYKDGTIERLFGSPFAPPSEDPTTGVSSKDIQIITSQVSARIYLPKNTGGGGGYGEKLPVLVYFHGGGFCTESAFSVLFHRLLNLLVAEANVVAVSVEYQRPPENVLPAAYDDSWAALQWVASHADGGDEKDPWLLNHADFNKLYLGGDSAGGNIVHNMLIRAGNEKLPSNVKIIGGFLTFPLFWGSKFEKSESNNLSLAYKSWVLAYPTAPNGIDNPMINPLANIPSLSRIGCSKLFVLVGDSNKDDLREICLVYVEELKKIGIDHVELAVVDEEFPCFHIFDPSCEKAKDLIKSLASFMRD
nr:HID3 [Vinca minor]